MPGQEFADIHGALNLRGVGDEVEARGQGRGTLVGSKEILH